MNAAIQEKILAEANRLHAAGQNVALKAIPWATEHGVSISEMLVLLNPVLNAPRVPGRS